ncbi:MAG: ABC transporter substrate-binding protein [Pseudotabrizicola sp.]|uniref:ABC transporter substrate-binding protein n=1 Tax=Pseudotabrizicola sp. TaxID=2939647 RepID=UPI002730C58C|nr:ABC transporter substrate-binding protein [Pseudotabrizicola sp.]MDP2080392.1 ABC transporter substrate-binding protein [Pseudotabrizicola sp.]MDZ7573764.1 ABC transporter substrate-binding protein [Pseudotabrizicola sp.]
MKTLVKWRLTAAAVTVSMIAGPALAEPLFWSTQAKPIEESQKMRDEVMAGFPGGVDYQPSDEGPWLTRMQAELQAGSGRIAVLGGLHGDLSSLGGDLVDLSGIDAEAVGPAMMELGALGSGEQKYIPWMQATYLMVANRKALEFLPEGADINALSYDQLIDWARATAEATGGPKFGFPAGPQGLKHRFFQGFLLPAYTKSTVTNFRSDEAVVAWETFRELWQYTNPAATNYSFMQEQLVTEEVWIAFDHVARIADAFNQRPDDFVAFPAPAGPMGRAFMPVVAGIAVPRTAPNMDESMALVAHMLKPETQIATLRATNFFPVIATDLPEDMPASVKASGPAIAAMTGAADALPALLPMGLGDKGGQFNQVYTDTFERIILAGQDIRTVLDSQAEVLRALMIEANAPCWAPDAASDGPCPVN